MEKLRLNTLSIEVTRRCNMSCGHCMRGDAQDMDIRHKDIRNVLKHIRSIGYFNITGGELSLNVKAIRYILKQVKRFEIEVYHFYIVTNGSESSLSAGFINTCCSLYDYQQEKDMRGSLRMLEMSDDRYHDHRLHKKVIDKLEGYPFFGLRGQAGTIFLYREGRSQSGNANPVRPLYLCEGNRLEGCVYLNAGGMVLSNGDLSYFRQTENELCRSGSFWSYVKHRVEKY
ncbi:radical SAM protein [Dysgonomonas sp. GY75]|uniref:radical SAM protein n=1 Tax=Dysgonomonas sp. GY75 TaxID=2780419 RepID=UPI001F54E45A|nr:radical SAM protein [Dysgonomonas sp. GY75]